MSYLYAIAIVLLILWILVLGRNSFWNTYQLKRQVEGLEKEAEFLKAVNDSLARENMRLKTDPEAAEKAAREQFGLTKPGEKVFRFVPSKENER
ncbi:MAG: septum formation initiator family protein [Candidatus Cloacimonetes bacterium]|nr:septum formation initiator family protein [Candidatus Cloacimonadota bacterium]MDD4148122.1 septum formation initiator family protein [Candidatus Cloacimonadota bacterium]